MRKSLDHTCASTRALNVFISTSFTLQSIAILRTLSPKDYVNVFYMAGSFLSIDADQCFSQRLVKATKSNIDLIISDLDKRYSHLSGNTDDQEALSKAEQFFKES